MIEHPTIEIDVPLAPLTTYKVGGPAAYFAEPNDLLDLRDVLEAVGPDIQIVVLGRGSNVVISDDGIDGLVVKLGHSFQAAAISRDGSIVAGGGMPLPKLARFAAQEGRGGLGFYVGIPGSVGGAVRMNAGGHGAQTADVLDHAVVLDARTAEVVEMTPTELALSYRHSGLTDTDIVVQATYHTHPADKAALDLELREITRWRKDNQPGGTLNAGSVFKNPPGDHAGAIIDRVGLKGVRFGAVAVSDVHANFMVAASDATASDIFRFVYRIKAIVRDETGIDLEPEIKFLGDFSSVVAPP
ncbi:MAG: UDP-N-acetylmuramate dehydrogenase [Actinomycetia bacterium]|nr:UDP-N-acetylmuramate dehydrogenase [Actinomycetes bacterium]